jgi:hypothetical protein
MPLARNHVPDATRRVLDIATSARDQVNVTVEYGLPCVLPAVHPNVEAGHGRVVGPDPFLQPLQQEVNPVPLRLPKPEEILDVSLANSSSDTLRPFS